jgi:hypothetical protein
MLGRDSSWNGHDLNHGRDVIETLVSLASGSPAESPILVTAIA